MAGAFEQAWAVLKSDPRMQAFTVPQTQRRHPDLVEHHGMEGRPQNLGTVDPNALMMAMSRFYGPENRHAKMRFLMNAAHNLGYNSKYGSTSPGNLTGKPDRQSIVYPEPPSPIPPTFMEGGFEGPEISRMSRPFYPNPTRAQRHSPQERIDDFINMMRRDPTDEELVALTESVKHRPTKGL